MSYELKSASALAGEPCCYANSRLPVRGPERELTQPYVAVMGGSEVFGRFVEQPFAAGAEALLGLPCVNLGSVNAGLDSFAQDKSLLAIARAAELTVLQVLGAQNISNRYYRVHPRRNDRFLQAQPALKALYPEVDFTEFHFNKHLLSTLRRVCEDRFATVQAHLQETWIDRMSEVTEALDGRVLLLWLQYDLTQGAAFTREPALVDRPMVDALRPMVEGVAEVPVQTAGPAGDTHGMVYGEMELPAARLMLGPRAHGRIAEKLAGRLAPLLDAG
ncbi:DUF6473 family protein [Roseobacteraceae bacterium NS-SX3]